MRICFFAPRFAPDLGGVATSATRIADALAALSHRVEVFAPTRSLPPGVVATAGEAPRVTRMGGFAHDDLTRQHLLMLAEDAHADAPFDLTWGHYLAPCGFLAVYAARAWGCRAVAAARGNDVEREMFAPAGFAQLTWTLRGADRVVAVCARLAGEIRTLVPESVVSVLPNAVDPERFAPADPDPGLRTALGLPTDEPVLGFSGELRYKKGAAYLLEAFAQVARERPARLLVIGHLRQRDREYLERLRLQDPDAAARVVITDHLDDPAAVARHLALCDLQILPSLWDGMPNSLLEAMAAGVPVLASDAGGIPEVLRDGVDGVIVPRRRLAELDAAIHELLDAPTEVRHRLTASARRRVVDGFSPDRERERLAGLLAGLA